MKNTIYELAFHLNPDLEETQIQQLAQNIESYIISVGGAVPFKKEPERVRLSYPIKHKRQAYFGYVHFTLDSPEKLVNIDEELKSRSDIWRYMTIKVPTTSSKMKFRFKPSKLIKEESAGRRTAEKPTPEQSKELDKELEGILENL